MSESALDLFDAEPALEGSAFEHAIVQIALDLAGRAGAAGITAADVRLVAARRGLEPPHASQQRAWSFLAPLFRKMIVEGQLVATGRYRRSPIPKSHGNAHLVYVAPPFHVEPR